MIIYDQIHSQTYRAYRHHYKIVFVEPETAPENLIRYYWTSIHMHAEMMHCGILSNKYFSSGVIARDSKIDISAQDSGFW